MHFTTTTILAAALLGVPQEEADQNRLLVVQHLEGTLGLLDPATGEATTTLRVGDGPRDVSASPDGELALVSLAGTASAGSKVAVVDLRAGRLARTVDLAWTDELGTEHSYYRPRSVTFLAKGERALVTVESHPNLLVLDVGAGVVLESIPLRLTGVREVQLDASGRRAFISGSTSGAISVVDIGQSRELDVIETGGGPSAMALHPTRNELWVANRETNSISVIDTIDLEETAEFPCGTFPSALKFTPDGKHLLCSNHQGGTLSVFQTEGRSVVEEIRLGQVSEEAAAERPVDHASRHFGRSALPTDIHVNEEGTLAWIACKRRDEVVEMDLMTFEISRRFPVGKGPTALAWTVFRGTRVEGK
jgi:DNA-binding beta-propeller fold protein YncE